MSDEQLLNRVWTYTLERLGQVSQDSNSGRRGCILPSAVDAKGSSSGHSTSVRIELVERVSPEVLTVCIHGPGAAP